MSKELSAPLPPIWFLKQDLRTSAQIGRLISSDDSLGVRNYWELQEARVQLGRATRSRVLNIPLPSDFPRIFLALPMKRFAPDYFEWGSTKLCSSRLRAVLNQPEDVIQFVPIELLSGSEAAYAQGYTQMRVLPTQPAVDVDASDCVFEDQLDKSSAKEIMFVHKLALRRDLQPKTEIFRPVEWETGIMVTDALALRILHSGCTGIAFADPTNHSYEYPKRYRTKTGILEWSP